MLLLMLSTAISPKVMFSFLVSVSLPPLLKQCTTIRAPFCRSRVPYPHIYTPPLHLPPPHTLTHTHTHTHTHDPYIPSGIGSSCFAVLPFPLHVLTAGILAGNLSSTVPYALGVSLMSVCSGTFIHGLLSWSLFM